MLSLCSKHKKDVKPHVFMGVLNEELLLAEAVSGRRFSKDGWVAECLALPEALVGNFVALECHRHQLVAAFHNVHVEDVFQQFLWEESVFFSFWILSRLHTQLTPTRLTMATY